MVVCIFSVLFYLISIFHFYFWKIIPPDKYETELCVKNREENMELLTLIVYIFSHAECHGSRKRGLLTLPIHKILSWNNVQTVIRLRGLNYCMLQCKIILIWNNLSECRGSNKCQIYETSYLPFDPSWCLCLFCCNEYRQHVFLPLELNICVTESYCTLVKIYKKLSKNKTIFLW